MRKLLIGFAVLSLLAAGPVVRMARADGDSASPEEVQRARQSLERMHREVVESEKQEKEQGAIARKRLATEFHVDASKMSDTDAIARLRDEVQARDAAKEAAEQRRKEQAEAQREKQQRALVKSQDAALKKTFGKTSDEIADDDDDDAAEQQMYESMVKQGVAPQCRGKKGQALVDCVDQAVGAQ